MNPGAVFCANCGYNRRAGVAGATNVDAMGGVAAPAPGRRGIAPHIPNYQRPGGGRAMDQGTSSFAINSMILGICSLVFFCFWKLALPASILAIVLGFMARSQFAEGRSGRGMAIAGITCGIISLCISVVLVVGVLSLIHYGGPALQKAQQQMIQQLQQYQRMQHTNLPTTMPGATPTAVPQ
jgi:hypothetical protein